MKKGTVTMADIAKEAGTHVTTVSLALRNSQRLSARTRERIQQLAREMGYAPDPWMRALVSYRNRNRELRNPPVLAYVTNWNSRWGWKNVTAHPDFYSGAEQKAKELGFILDHFWIREPGMTHDRLSKIFHTRGIAGIIVASHVREIDDYLGFEWENFSAVKIDYFPHKPELFTVTNNHQHIIRLAMQRVMEAGYRRIAFVMDRGWDETVDNNWSAGFLWEQQKLAAEDRLDAYLIPGIIWEEQYLDSRGRVEPDMLPHHAGLKNWLLKARPEVIISKDQFVFPVLEDLGWKIPRDVAFVDLFLEDSTGRFAGVKQNHATVGALAVETVAGQIQHNQRGIPEIPTTSLVEGTWIDGGSLPPAKSRHGKHRRRAGTVASRR